MAKLDVFEKEEDTIGKETYTDLKIFCTKLFNAETELKKVLL